MARAAIDRARTLRRDGTDAEKKLWRALKESNLPRFRRQHPIGRFIADFACPEHRLVIEVDGGQHADNAADGIRTKQMEELGWRVLRFWNNEVLANTDGVITAIGLVLDGPPHLTPRRNASSLSRPKGPERESVPSGGAIEPEQP